MLARAPLGSPLARADSVVGGATIADAHIRELNTLAVRGLVSMLDPDKQLFCHRLLQKQGGMLREGISPRYTIMTLLGLREVEQTRAEVPFNTNALHESLVRDTKWVGGIGDLGLLLWLTASFAPDRLEELYRLVDIQTALERYPDARQGRTTELAWFLAGVAHAALTSPKQAHDLTDLAVETYHRMEETQGECGFFGHMSETKSLAGIVRGRIGSFADQIYPIYAMSKFALAFDVEEPLGAALECAAAICSAQGPLGQWWWLYDSHTGRVASRYPVYSVHQQGMAPMGLFALEEVTHRSFGEAIHKGLAWIFGANEMSVDMRDSEHNVVWRCIRPKSKVTKYLDTALSVVRSPKADAPSGALEILYEDRPYELGWLLFAFARLGMASS